jgi:hypothetical protein
VIEGNQWRVYEWLRAGPPLAPPVGATITRGIGDILATMGFGFRGLTHGCRHGLATQPLRANRLAATDNAACSVKTIHALFPSVVSVKVSERGGHHCSRQYPDLPLVARSCPLMGR